MDKKLQQSDLILTNEFEFFDCDEQSINIEDGRDYWFQILTKRQIENPLGYIYLVTKWVWDEQESVAQFWTGDDDCGGGDWKVTEDHIVFTIEDVIKQLAKWHVVTNELVNE